MVEARLRPEIKPLEWKELDGEQRKAFREIIGWFTETLENLKDPPREAHCPVRLDPDQSSRVGLLSGDRGTGKTSLLYSIIQTTSMPPAASKTTNRDQSEEGSDANTAWPGLNGLNGKLIWLEPLEMEVLPGPSNLISAILARVEKVLPRLSSLHSAALECDPGGILDPGEEIDKSRMNLRRLQTNVALAWYSHDVSAHPNLSERALEVMRIERARLELNSLLDQVLCDLIRPHFQRVFVLPVDDFDLNPLRCLELLQLIRMLNVPRLFVIILGDIDIAESVLNLRLSGDFAKVAGNALGKSLSINEEEVSAMVAATAANAMRKLIPPVQRVQLGCMTVREALNYRPHSNSESIQDLLEKLPVEMAIRVGGIRKSEEEQLVRFSKLARFLLMTRFESEDAQSPQQEKPGSDLQKAFGGSYHYTGTAILKAPPRHVADFWFTLNKLVQENQGKSDSDGTNRFESQMASMLGEFIKEEATLTPATRRSALTQLEEDTEQVVQLRTDAFSALRSKGPAFRVKMPGPCDLLAFTTPGWSIYTRPLGSKPSDHAQRILNERTEAALILLHDLLASRPVDRLIGPPLPGQQGGEGFAATEWTVAGADEIVLPWPSLGWPTFWQYDLFATIWNRCVQTVQIESAPSRDPAPENRKANYLAYAYLRAALRVDLLDAAFQEVRPLSCFKDSEESNHLRERIYECYFKESGQTTDQGAKYHGPQLDRRFFVLLATLLAPEIGLPEEIARAFGSEKRFEKRLEDPITAEAIQHVRRLRADAFSAAGAAHFADGLIYRDGLRPRIREILNKIRDTLEKWPLTKHKTALFSNLQSNITNEAEYYLWNRSNEKALQRFEDYALQFAARIFLIGRTEGGASPLRSTRLAEKASEMARTLKREDKIKAAFKEIESPASQDLTDWLQDAVRQVNLYSDFMGSSEVFLEASKHPINQLGDGVLCPLKNP